MYENIRNALAQTGAGGVGNLIPEDLEPTLIEYLYTVSPLLSLVPKKRANGSTHSVNLRTGVPSAWAEGELTTPTFVSSTYARQNVDIKITRVSGGVSNFAQAATRNYIDLLQAELEALVEGMATALEFQLMWGNDNDAYQFSGIDTFMTEGSSQVFDQDGTVTLTLLDNMIDHINQYRGVSRDQKLFIMSDQMVSKVSGLETRVGMDLRSLDYEGGFRMFMYRDIPMLSVPYVRPAPTTTSPAVTATEDDGGGTLADGTFRYKIASVTENGEQVAGTAGSETNIGGGDAAIDLTWTADANAKLYKIFRTAVDEADDDDNYDLLAVIAAKTYDSSGLVTGNVAAYTDDGSITPNSDIHPLASGEETIWLLNVNPARGISFLYLPNDEGAPADGAFDWMRLLPLARTKSSQDYMLEAFSAMQVPQEETCVLARRVSPT